MATIYGTNTGNSISGTAGNDLLYGWDSLNGAGDFGPADDSDTLFGGAGADRIDGGAGNDYLSDSTGANTLYGGAGDDTVDAVFAVGTHVYGGDGVDVLMTTGYATGPLNFVFGDPAVELVVRGLHITGFEALSIIASDFNDSITLGAGNDAVLASSGDDFLAGGDGDDTLYGSAGADTLLGGTGDDRLVVFDRAGADVIDGGDGIDLVEFIPGTAKRTVTLAVSASFVLPDGLVVTGVERISYAGTAGNDRITGGAYADTLEGNGGADVLDGRGGDDYLRGRWNGSGGPVAQTLLGGSGNDFISFFRFSGGESLWGGKGIDVLEFALVPSGGGGAIFAAASLKTSFVMANGVTLGGFERIDLAATDFNDSITGGAFGDTIVGLQGDDSLYGGGGDDEVYGGTGRGQLFGGGGNDTLYDADGAGTLSGGAGNDRLQTMGAQAQVLYGGDGDDSLFGGGGDDLINGGRGADVLRGGAGADRFDFTAAPLDGVVDVIEDFTSGVDRMRLDASAFAGLTAGRLRAAAFVAGTAAADASDRIVYDAATGAVWFDADGLGGGAAAHFATVTAQSVVTAADFTVL